MNKTNNFAASRRRVILASGGLYHFFHDSIADGLTVLLPLWQIAFNLSLTHVGLIVTCFEGATACFQIPASFLGERFGERLLLSIGTLITAISFISIGFAGSYFSLATILLIGGFAAGVQHPLSSSLISRTYKDRGHRMALGSYNFAGDVGKFAFPALAAMVLSIIDWRFLCIGYGLFGCIITIGLYGLLKRFNAGEIESYKKDMDGHQSIGSWGIENKRAFSILSVIGFIDTGVRIGLSTFIPFLLIKKGISVESVGFAISLLFVGGAIGKFLCGVIAERVGITTSIVITEFITGGGILMLIKMPMPIIYIFLPILGAALNGTSTVLYGAVSDFVLPRQIARSFGLFYTFVIAAAAVAPPIFGVISDLSGIANTIRLIGLCALTPIPLAYMLSRCMNS